MNGWDVQPTLDWAIARSTSRIVRHRLIVTPGSDPASPAAHLRDELRLRNLVILSWSAPQPAVDDLAVAQPTTVFINRLVRGPEPAGDSSPR
jgi:hypothetical protein